MTTSKFFCKKFGTSRHVSAKAWYRLHLSFVAENFSLSNEAFEIFHQVDSEWFEATLMLSLLE
ncbi:hypothetical protein ACL6C3_26785 [Capilliphycus salinus ALCB114379]|uniref:hypothetical protein n=1 Tax=Capilliphycus salinus TaxID=2768948 RepID=UPI0039A68AE0